MDFVGPLSPDKYGNKYILVVIDNFTRFVELFVTSNCSSDEAAKAILSIYGRYGLPRVIHTDQGSHFTANIVEELCEYLSVKKQYSLPYRPQANGIVERANRSILERLREMVFSKRLVRHSEHIWSDLLPLVQRAINASIHSATGTSPARILFGKNLDLDRLQFLGEKVDWAKE
jgi:transposase InsO family protein